MTAHKHPSAAFWATVVVVVVLVLYPVSYGPVPVLVRLSGLAWPFRACQKIYLPLEFVAAQSRWAQGTLARWQMFWIEILDRHPSPPKPTKAAKRKP